MAAPFYDTKEMLPCLGIHLGSQHWGQPDHFSLRFTLTASMVVVSQVIISDDTMARKLTSNRSLHRSPPTPSTIYIFIRCATIPDRSGQERHFSGGSAIPWTVASVDTSTTATNATATCSVFAQTSSRSVLPARGLLSTRRAIRAWLLYAFMYFMTCLAPASRFSLSAPSEIPYWLIRSVPCTVRRSRRKGWRSNSRLCIRTSTVSSRSWATLGRSLKVSIWRSC